MKTVLSPLISSIPSRLSDGTHIPFAARQLAAAQIERGVQFCRQNGLNLKVALDSRFDIANRFLCIFGLNCGDYDDVVKAFELRRREAASKGFFPSRFWKGLTIEKWGEVFNPGWKAACGIFRDN